MRPCTGDATARCQSCSASCPRMESGPDKGAGNCERSERAQSILIRTLTNTTLTTNTSHTFLCPIHKSSAPGTGLSGPRYFCGSHTQNCRSWKRTFRRAVMSRSTSPRFIDEWVADIKIATSMEHSGFAFDHNRMEFDTLDSEIVKEIAKIFPPFSEEGSIC